MKEKIEYFENEDYKFISNMIENKIYRLKKYEDYNQKYRQLFDTIDELETTLNNEQKEKFHKITKLFYETEEYYFTFAYYLGEKHGKTIWNIKQYKNTNQNKNYFVKKKSIKCKILSLSRLLSFLNFSS